MCNRRSWPSVQMQQPNMAAELKEEQELWDLKPEARNRNETGWEGLGVSNQLFPAFPCSLFTANTPGGCEEEDGDCRTWC